ncbi:MAG: hypothetical protein AVDCRST_MAG01-01-5256, partial [uncultured Rubrobacteraceae bacterium]
WHLLSSPMTRASSSGSPTACRPAWTAPPPGCICRCRATAGTRGTSPRCEGYGCPSRLSCTWGSSTRPTAWRGPGGGSPPRERRWPSSASPRNAGSAAETPRPSRRCLSSTRRLRRRATP